MVISAFLGTIVFVFSFLGTTEELPFGVDSFLIQQVQNWNGFLDNFWPLVPVWRAFLIYLAFMGALWFAKLLFGHRLHHAGAAE